MAVHCRDVLGCHSALGPRDISQASVNLVEDVHSQYQFTRHINYNSSLGSGQEKHQIKNKICLQRVHHQSSQHENNIPVT